MDMSVFDLFKIGIGPSSSHTVGPMLAAARFLLECGPLALDEAVAIEVALYGSLALTGIGHATDKAVILGLMGETPQGVDPEQVDTLLAEVELDGSLKLLGQKAVPFSAKTGLAWHRSASLPEHPNGMRFTLKLFDGSIESAARASMRSSSVSLRSLLRARSAVRRSLYLATITWR